MPKVIETSSQAAIRSRISGQHKSVKSWEKFHSTLESMRDTAWIFRGVGSLSHYPIPSIGRKVEYGDYVPAQEKRLFQEFKKRAVALLPNSNFNDWDLLAYAQHVGVPTRLLDWTASPLIATFFALESNSDEDRVIYAVKYSQYIHEVPHEQHGPFENSKEGRFTAPLAFDRLRAQRVFSRFTLIQRKYSTQKE